MPSMFNNPPREFRQERLEALPTTLVLQEDAIKAWLFMSSGVLMVSVPFVVWLELGHIFWPAFITILVAVLPIFVGSKMMIDRSLITFDEEKVTFEGRSLGGWIFWEEPLPDYKGIFCDKVAKKDKMEFLVKLLHKDEGKTLTLHRTQKGDEVLDVAKKFGKLFNLKVM